MDDTFLVHAKLGSESCIKDSLILSARTGREDLHSVNSFDGTCAHTDMDHSSLGAFPKFKQYHTDRLSLFRSFSYSQLGSTPDGPLGIQGCSEWFSRSSI